MKNEGAVWISKHVQEIGVGLLEQALEREGQKGCSPILCSEPVPLEPPYQRFDTSTILGLTLPSPPDSCPPAPVVRFVTFVLFASADDILSVSWMETVLRAIAVLPGPFAFELFGEGGRVWVRVAVPEGQVAGFRAAVLGHFPAVVFREVETPFPDGVPVAVNEVVPVAPYFRTQSLLGSEGASPLGLAVVALSELPAGAAGVLQVAVCPAAQGHDWHSNVENALEAEERAGRLAQLGGLSSSFRYDSALPPLQEPSAREKVRVDVAFFAMVVRYALWNAGEEAAEHFMQGMRVATGMVRFGNRAWRVLSHNDLVDALGPENVRRMVVERLTYRPGVMVTSREVATFVHLPNARTLSMLSTIEQRRGLEWRPLPAGGAWNACLGVNSFAGIDQEVVVPLDKRVRHSYVLGTTGSGKSELLKRMTADDAVQGAGFCLVDPHGDLCLDIVSRLPEERLRDMVYMSFGEEGLVPRWNPFAARVPAGKLADDVAGAFLAQAAVSGARMEHNLRMLAFVVHAIGGTLEDFAELAHRSPRGEMLREQALGRVRNPQVQRFLQTDLPGYSTGELASVRNKLSRLLLDENLGAMFRHSENALEPREWLDTGRIVLVNLAAGRIGTDHARFVGSLLVSLLFRAALSRADIPARERRPYFLYIDEFQQLQAATLSDLLSEGRKYGVGAVLAHQERGQLGKALSQALGNCATKVVLRPAEDDLAYCRKVLGSRVDDDALRSLGVGQGFVSCQGQVASLATELTGRPVLRDGRAAALAYAREHYASVELGAGMVRRARVFDSFGGAE